MPFRFRRLVFPSTLLIFLASCDQKSTVQEKADEKPEIEELAYDPRFSAWYSRAELQFRMEQIQDDQYFSSVQGRLHKGENQYRAITDDFDSSRFEKWAVFWGLDEEEIYEKEIALLRRGYEKQESQVFTDSADESVHQLVMILPKGALDLTGDYLKTVNPDRETLAGVGSLSIPETTEPEDRGEHSIDRIPENISVDPAVAQVVEEDPMPVPLDSGDPEPTLVTPNVDFPLVGPTPESEAEPTPEPEPTPAPEPEVATIRSHTVKTGDTLSSVARKYGISVSALKRENGLTSDVIRLDQVLKIPGS